MARRDRIEYCVKWYYKKWDEENCCYKTMVSSDNVFASSVGHAHDIIEGLLNPNSCEIFCIYKADRYGKMEDMEEIEV
jgi:hypothetical protein